MSEREFPPKLISQCAVATSGVGMTGDQRIMIARAVLRESGHAELVAALTRARMCLVFLSALGSKDPVLAEIDAALRKAGAL